MDYKIFRDKSLDASILDGLIVEPQQEVKESPRELAQRMLGYIPDATPKTWEEVNEQAKDLNVKLTDIVFGTDSLHALTQKVYSFLEERRATIEEDTGE